MVIYIYVYIIIVYILSRNVSPDICVNPKYKIIRKFVRWESCCTVRTTLIVTFRLQYFSWRQECFVLVMVGLLSFLLIYLFMRND